MRKAKQDRLAPRRCRGYNWRMSWTRRFIWLFWIFVISMLLWQCYQYNAELSKPGATPQQQHFFFYQPTPGKAPPVEHEGPFVEQTAFAVADNTPAVSSFTCHITLKNTGKGKAINVSVCVRPYRGTLLNNGDDGGHNDTKLIDDNSPRAQINQWVTFPDLDPGQSSTQSVIFYKEGASSYGTNPKPDIVYQPEKKK
jgi:hypothetical protein